MPSRIFALALALVLVNTGTMPAAKPVNFNRDIRPILSNNCFACHGPDKNERQADLRLDQREGALSKLESGTAAIVPGDVAGSELIRRIQARGDDRMPPAETQKQLTASQRDLLMRWIGQGAE
ncbi:MAG: c-type cytochrome domain-containing protein [Pirellulaceae bacterium]